MPKTPNGNEIQIRRIPFLPTDLEMTPQRPDDIRLTPSAILALVSLFGVEGSSSSSAGVFPWGALKVATYGSGFKTYSIKAGTQASAYNATDILQITDGYFQRFDILVETQEALIQFLLMDSLAWGGDIPLNVGYHSMEFTSAACRIKYRTTSGGTYTIVGYR